MAIDNQDRHYTRNYSARDNARTRNTREHVRVDGRNEQRPNLTRRSSNPHDVRKNQNRRYGAHNHYFEKDDAVVHHKLETPICPRCNEPITDLPSALAEKGTNAPVHFDCVLAYLNENEKLNQNEKITYIGQGRFAVVHFENPHDTRHFNIVRIIEWEERDKKYEWRTNIAGLYSQVK